MKPSDVNVDIRAGIMNSLCGGPLFHIEFLWRSGVLDQRTSWVESRHRALDAAAPPSRAVTTAGFDRLPRSVNADAGDGDDEEDEDEQPLKKVAPRAVRALGRRSSGCFLFGTHEKLSTEQRAVRLRK